MRGFARPPVRQAAVAIRKPCQNNGVCQDDKTCDCRFGFVGADCSKEICNPNPCKNGASCTVNVDGTSTSCFCPQGFNGPLCENNINDCTPDSCLNGGTCEDRSCKCEPGWEGNQCQTDIDDCDPDPCVNGGVCNDGLNSYSCACLLGFCGDRCETDGCLADWEFCSTSSQCNSGCCSSEYSDDGLLKCTPLGGNVNSDICVLARMRS